MPAPQVLQSLADAIGGVDREGMYRKGMAERADIDATEAQTEAAIQLARDRRLDAQEKERVAAAQEELREQIRRAQAEAPPGSRGMDQTALDPFNVMQAGFGDEYAGQQQGRLRAQEYNFRERVGEPTTMALGEEIEQIDPALAHEMLRESSLEALAPASALATRRMDPSFEMVLQPDGSSIYLPSEQAGGQPVGGRPSQAGGSAANAGGLTTAVQSAIYRQSAGLFGGTYDPLTGRFAGLDREGMANVQRLASRASTIMRAGGIDIATAVDQALNEAQQAAAAGSEIPPQFGDAVDPTDDVDPQTGQPWEATDAQGNKVRWVNGQWVPVPQ
jgi:hypothetical protein